ALCGLQVFFFCSAVKLPRMPGHLTVPFLSLCNFPFFHHPLPLGFYLFQHIGKSSKKYQKRSVKKIDFHCNLLTLNL
ncbi:MAG: hypothetical protein ACLVKG_26665, partial [Blautia coccoides]